MNSAWPVFHALSMQCLQEEERAGFVVIQSALWSLTWSISSGISGKVQDLMGVRAFDLLFGITLVLYALATLYWIVFPRFRSLCGRFVGRSV